MENTALLPRKFSKKWGTPAEQPAVTDEEPQIIDKNITENENHELIPKTSRNPETSQESPTQSSPKTSEKNPRKRSNKNS